MALVSLVTAEQAPLTAQPLYAAGQPDPIVAALAHVPEVLEAALPFIGTVLGPSAIAVRTKEIVILRTSAVAGCAYCTAAHTVVARDVGLTLEEVRALRGETGMGAFACPAEAALIRWVDEVAATPAAPSESTAEVVREHYGEPAVVELTLLAGATLMLNRFATCLGLPTSPRTLARLADEGLLPRGGAA